MNILIACNRGISSKYIFHTLCDIAESYYRKYNKTHKIYFLSQYADKKKVYNLFRKEKRSVFFDEIILYNPYCNHLDYTKAENWLEIYNDIDVSDLPKFDKIIEIGSALSEGANIQRGKINYNKLFNNSAQFKYLSVRNIKQYLMFIYKIVKTQDIELEHYIIDPQEFDYRDIDKEMKYSRHFQYNSKLLDFKQNNSFLESYLIRDADYNKEIDFTFGYTVLTKDRKNDLFEFLTEDLKDFETVLLVKDKFKDIDTFVNKNEYLNYIRASKYTLIMPAYDNRTFSIFRFIESIYNGCIPLILEDNYLDEVKETFYIPDDIIVNKESIKDKLINLNYDKIIKDLKDKNGKY